MRRSRRNESIRPRSFGVLSRQRRCLLNDGDIVAAASEERFTRKKGDAAFPHHAVTFCLEQAGIGVQDLTAIGFYDKPLLKFERILETYLAVAPAGFRSFLKAGPLWIKDKLHIDRQLKDALAYSGEILYCEHHESHAASAFFPSPFEQAAILTMDGVGEWATASIGMGQGDDIEILAELHWPDSLGLLYSAFTYYTGFKVNSGEYKVMGLAPYGEPTYVDLIYRELLDLREDGSFRLNQKYFNYLTGLTMTSAAFDELFGGPPRQPESKLTQKEMDLARSVQVVCEEIMLRMARTRTRPHRRRRTFAWPAASRSTASATAGCCARDRSRTSGSSRRPAMPVARSASLSSCTIGTSSSLE